MENMERMFRKVNGACRSVTSGASAPSRCAHAPCAAVQAAGPGRRLKNGERVRRETRRKIGSQLVQSCELFWRCACPRQPSPLRKALHNLHFAVLRAVTRDGCTRDTCNSWRAARENIVGWYSTGPRLREADLDIHALISNYCADPVFVICEVQVQSLLPR